jgi:hypothetical protein
MGRSNAKELARKHAELKAKLPIALVKAQKDDAIRQRVMPAVDIIRDRVF